MTCYVSFNTNRRAERHHSTPHPFGEGCSLWRKRPLDKDRIAGSAQQIKGAVKQVAGKALGDAKLEADGKADKIEGKVQNAVGGLKDTLRGK